MYFLGLEERKNVQKSSRQREKPKNAFFFFLGLKVPGAFYSLGMLFEAATLQGPPSSNGLESG